MKKYVLSAILFVVLIILTYVFVLKGCDFNLLIESIKNTNPFFVFLTILCVFGYVFFGSLFLKRILWYFGSKVSFYHTFGYIFTEIYFSAITPSNMGGQPVQMIEMKKDKISYQSSSVLVLFNTMMNRIVLIFIATIFFIIFNKEIFNINPFYNWVVILGYITTILVILLFAALIYSKKIANLLLKLSNFLIEHLKLIKNKDKLKKKLAKSLKEYQSCSKITKEKPKLVIESFIILFSQRISLLLASYTVYKAFGLNEYGILLIMAFQVCVTLGSDLMPTPGGVMINEGLLLSVNNMLYGESLALSGMLLLRSFNFYFLVIISAILYFVFHYIKRKPASDI